MSEYSIGYYEDLLPTDVRNSIADYTIVRLTVPGENYGGLLLRIDIKTKLNEKLHFVAKCSQRNKDMQDKFDAKHTFKNEIGWYEEVIPMYQKFQMEANVEELFDWAPKYYGSRFVLNPGCSTGDVDGVILLENMTVKGYKMESRFNGFDLETTTEVLKRLALFHAIGMALKIKKPNLFRDIVMPYLKNEKRDVENFSSTVIDFLEKEKPEFKQMLGRIKEALKHRFSGNQFSSDLWKTAVHNDFWINNILLKKDHGKIHVAVLDYQLASYESIASELMFFLINTVNASVVKEQMDNFLMQYHQEFTKHLRKYEVETEKFRYEDFLEELKMQGKNVFARSVFAILIIYNENTEMADPNDEQFNSDGFLETLMQNLTQRHKDKYCFLVEEFAKRNWI